MSRKKQVMAAGMVAVVAGSHPWNSLIQALLLLSLSYYGGVLLGVTAQVIDIPLSCTKEQSEIDVSSGWTLCPLCLRFVRETVVESSSNIEEFGNAD
ncbi:unnamed protein product [Brassica oleracea var. botrytis]